MRAIAAVMAFVAGEAMNVRRVCEEVGISRQSIYKYVARCRVEGLAGFEPRSRRPRCCAQAVGDQVVRADTT